MNQNGFEGEERNGEWWPKRGQPEGQRFQRNQDQDTQSKETDWWDGCCDSEPKPWPGDTRTQAERRTAGDAWAAQRGGWEVQNRNAAEVVRQQKEKRG